jgi:hypothetical protein
MTLSFRRDNSNNSFGNIETYGLECLIFTSLSGTKIQACFYNYQAKMFFDENLNTPAGGRF